MILGLKGVVQLKYGEQVMVVMGVCKRQKNWRQLAEWEEGERGGGEVAPECLRFQFLKTLPSILCFGSEGFLYSVWSLFTLSQPRTVANL